LGNSRMKRHSLCKDCGSPIVFGGKRCKKCRGRSQWTGKCLDCNETIRSSYIRCKDCRDWREGKKYKATDVEPFVRASSSIEDPPKRKRGRPVKGNFIDGCIEPDPNWCWEVRCSGEVVHREKRMTGPRGAFQEWPYCDRHWQMIQKVRGSDRDWHECFLHENVLDSIYLVTPPGLMTLQVERNKRNRRRKNRKAIEK
jgi:hypothetical protein